MNWFDLFTSSGAAGHSSIMVHLIYQTATFNGLNLTGPDMYEALCRTTLKRKEDRKSEVKLKNDPLLNYQSQGVSDSRHRVYSATNAMP